MTDSISLNLFGKIYHARIVSLIIILLFAGIVLRVFNLEVTGLWMDEIHSANGSDPDKTVHEVLVYCKQDQPPVFFLLLHGWYKIFPFSDFSGRILVILTGALGIFSMYYVGKEFKNEKAGLAAAFITTINYFHVDFSRQVRFYPLVFLFASLSFLFFLRVFKRRRLTDFILYVVSTAGLLNTHYFGMVVFASQFILFIFIILWKKEKDLKFILSSLLSGILVGLSFLHWLPVVLSDLGIPSFHVQPVPWYFPVMYFWVYFRDFVTCAICAVLSFFTLQQIYFRIKIKTLLIEDVILLGWVGLGFLIPLLYSWIRMPMLEYKYSFIAVPGIFIFVALGLESMQKPQIKLWLIIILFFSFLVNALFIKSIYFRTPFEAWREVTKEIAKTYTQEDIVFSEYAWYYNYYFKIYNLPRQAFPPQYGDFKGLTDQFKGVWILTQTKYPNKGLTPEQQEHLTANFKLTKEFKSIDTHARYFVKR